MYICKRCERLRKNVFYMIIVVLVVLYLYVVFVYFVRLLMLMGLVCVLYSVFVLVSIVLYKILIYNR